MLGVVPISHLISKLSQNEIRICGYGLGSRGTRALAMALVVSSPFVLLFFRVCLTGLKILGLFDSRCSLVQQHLLLFLLKSKCYLAPVSFHCPLAITIHCD